MSHLDPEQLALLALGEPVASESERDHLASCPVCAADVAEMTHAASVARSTLDETELETPPARVWEAIADGARTERCGAGRPARRGPGTQTMTDAAPRPHEADPGRVRVRATSQAVGGARRPAARCAEPAIAGVTSITSTAPARAHDVGARGIRRPHRRRGRRPLGGSVESRTRPPSRPPRWMRSPIIRRPWARPRWTRRATARARSR